MSSDSRLRLCGESWVTSEGRVLPLTLWAGVGSVVVVDAMELVMLIIRSLVLGENWEGLCGVCGWQDMMDRCCKEVQDEMRSGAKILAQMVAWLGRRAPTLPVARTPTLTRDSGGLADGARSDQKNSP